MLQRATFSSDPNLPEHSALEGGHRVLCLYRSRVSVFLACDYSRVDLLHLSADEHLVATFNSGADFHAATAARVFGVPVEEVTPALLAVLRQFWRIYGQQAFGL